MWHDFSEDPTYSGEYLCCYLSKDEEPYYLFHKYNKDHECWIDLTNPLHSKPDKWMRIPDPRVPSQYKKMIKDLLASPFDELTNEEVFKRLDFISLLDSYITYFKTGKIVLGDWRKWVIK